eukprot:403365426
MHTQTIFSILTKSGQLLESAKIEEVTIFSLTIKIMAHRRIVYLLSLLRRRASLRKKKHQVLKTGSESARLDGNSQMVENEEEKMFKQQANNYKLDNFRVNSLDDLILIDNLNQPKSQKEFKISNPPLSFNEYQQKNNQGFIAKLVGTFIRSNPTQEQLQYQETLKLLAQVTKVDQAFIEIENEQKPIIINALYSNNSMNIVWPKKVGFIITSSDKSQDKIKIKYPKKLKDRLMPGQTCNVRFELKAKRGIPVDEHLRFSINLQDLDTKEPFGEALRLVILVQKKPPKRFKFEVRNKNSQNFDAKQQAQNEASIDLSMINNNNQNDSNRSINSDQVKNGNNNSNLGKSESKSLVKMLSQSFGSGKQRVVKIQNELAAGSFGFNNLFGQVCCKTESNSQPNNHNYHQHHQLKTDQPQHNFQNSNAIDNDFFKNSENINKQIDQQLSFEESKIQKNNLSCSHHNPPFKNTNANYNLCNVSYDDHKQQVERYNLQKQFENRGFKNSWNEDLNNREKNQVLVRRVGRGRSYKYINNNNSDNISELAQQRQIHSNTVIKQKMDQLDQQNDFGNSNQNIDCDPYNQIEHDNYNEDSDIKIEFTQKYYQNLRNKDQFQDKQNHINGSNLVNNST